MKFPLLWKFYFSKWKFYFSADISYDDEKDLKAIVFVIGGYGANANIYFLDSYRNYIAKNFDVVTINVFYHCFCQRRSDVEKYSTLADFTKDDLKLIEKVLRKYNIPCDQLANNTVVSHCEYLSEIMTELKMLNRLPYDFEERLSATFIPSRGEYQNFGIMAAIDHINALKDLVKRFPEFADLPKIYGGGVLWRIPIFTHSKDSSLVCGWCD
ncbi:DUF2920 family protein [Campylobacter coli]|nr:DUF2920 family protein [Campylobacter coli]EJD2719344.1 DUF2920 family protein [Campylobacter coli]ELE2962016.1 DUF2920 family protein [Campylobacter coli]